MTTSRLTFLALICGVLLAACGGGEDPKQSYADLVKAAQAGDGAYMYEALDKGYRAEVDTMMARQTAMIAQMPADERAKWEPLKGLKGKDAFAKMVTLNRNDPRTDMTSRFKGDYSVLKVDTVVVLTIQHKGQQPDLMYMRLEDGKYRVTAPPAPPSMPQGEMPPGHPDVGQDPHAAPQSPAPQVPSDSGKR
jgi:hypothetical protein